MWPYLDLNSEKTVGNEKNLTPFKPGECGNPNGRPADPPALKAIKQMSKGEFKVLIHKLIDLKPDELKDFRGTVLEMAMASAMQKAIKSGEFDKIQSFIERLFGKVKEEVVLHKLSDEEIAEEVQRRLNGSES